MDRRSRQLELVHLDTLLLMEELRASREFAVSAPEPEPWCESAREQRDTHRRRSLAVPHTVQPSASVPLIQARRSSNDLLAMATKSSSCMAAHHGHAAATAQRSTSSSEIVVCSIGHTQRRAFNAASALQSPKPTTHSHRTHTLSGVSSSGYDHSGAELPPNQPNIVNEREIEIERSTEAASSSGATSNKRNHKTTTNTTSL